MNRQQKFQEHQTIGQTLVLALKISKYFIVLRTIILRYVTLYLNEHYLTSDIRHQTSSTVSQNIIAILAHFFTIFYSNCTLNEISPMTLKLKQPSYLSFTFYCYYNPNNNNILFSKDVQFDQFLLQKTPHLLFWVRHAYWC